MDDLPGPEELSSFDVPGDPASCHRTARRLRHLAGALEEAAGFLARQSRVSPGLAGLSAAAYRRRCGLLDEQATDLARRSRLLASGLGELADDLAHAQTLMARAERLAAGHGLVLDGLLVPPSGPPSWTAGGDVPSWTAWSRARSQIRRARTIEVAAQQAWSQLLLRHAGHPVTHDLPAAPPRPAVPPVPDEPSPHEPGPRECGPSRGPRPDPADGPHDTSRTGDGGGRSGPRLEPWTCGLTPEPDGFCGTPDDPLDPYVPRSPETGVDLPGTLGSRAGGGVSGRAAR